MNHEYIQRYFQWGGVYGLSHALHQGSWISGRMSRLLDVLFPYRAGASTHDQGRPSRRESQVKILRLTAVILVAIPLLLIGMLINTFMALIVYSVIAAVVLYLIYRMYSSKPKTMRIFVSGPMSGYPNYNFDKFRKVEERLRVRGHDVTSGRFLFESEIARGITRPHKEYQRAALLHMLAFGADAIAQLDGWEQSSGATGEAAVALNLGMEFLDEYGVKVKRPTYIAVVSRDEQEVAPLSSDDVEEIVKHD